MLTAQQIANLKKGDKLLYNNNGNITEWEVDYPKYLNNEKKSIIVYENNDVNSNMAKQVAVESVAGGGECTNKEFGCVRVSMLLTNGRGPKRFSMLVSDWDNWELPEVEETSGTGATGDTGSTGDTGGTEEESAPLVTIISVSPVNNAENVLTKPELKFIFSGIIKPGSGNLRIIDSTTSETITIPVTDTTQVHILANVLQINVAVELNRGTTYQVVIDDPGYVLDSNNLPINILGDNTYSFTTSE